MKRTPGRASGVVLALAAASLGLLRLSWLPGLSWSRLPAALASTSPDRSLPLLLSLALCCLSGCLALTMAATVAATAPGAFGRLAGAALEHLAPLALRRTAEVLIGATTVLAATAGAAQAGGPAVRPAAVHQQAAFSATLDRPVTPGPVVPPGPAFDLDRPARDPAYGIALVSHHPTRTLAAQEKSLPRQTTVTVKEGDSLWRIAARALPPGAGDTAIARSCHRWYEANRGVIGPDPNLLQPGQRLTAPTAD